MAIPTCSGKWKYVDENGKRLTGTGSLLRGSKHQLLIEVCSVALPGAPTHHLGSILADVACCCLGHHSSAAPILKLTDMHRSWSGPTQ